MEEPGRAELEPEISLDGMRSSEKAEVPERTGAEEEEEEEEEENFCFQRYCRDIRWMKAS